MKSSQDVLRLGLHGVAPASAGARLAVRAWCRSERFTEFSGSPGPEKGSQRFSTGNTPQTHLKSAHRQIEFTIMRDLMAVSFMDI